MVRKKIFGSVVAAIASLAVWWCQLTADDAFTSVFFTTVIGVGVYFGFKINQNRRKYSIPEKSNMASVAGVILQKMVEMRKNFRPCEKKTVISRNIDVAIQEILDLTIRDYIMTWYSELAKDKERFPHVVEDELWNILEKLSERLRSMDMVQFMTKDIVSMLHKHFQDIREASTRPAQGKERAKFMLHPWLSSDETELDFLRTVADVMLIHLLPEHYAKVHSVRHLLREILACAMFKPTIEHLCDPDYINQSLYNWLDYRERLAWEHKSTYTYAATYESFMEMIEKCEDLEHLKQMRYNIISEIMQATAIQHLKRLKGEDTEKESNPKGTAKGDLLKARNLSRYINQLSICKNYCEKRIYHLGGPDYKSYTSATSDIECNMPGKKVLSFAVVMQTEGARNYFYKYLMKTNDDDLLKFWAAVENMKHLPKKQWHKQAGDMYEMFLAHPGMLLRLHFEKALIKRMEAFMKGNMGPDAFHEAQDQVYKTLEEQFYPSFIISDLYHQYMGSSQRKTHIPSLPVSDLSGKLPESSTSALLTDVSKDTMRIIEHCSYAHEKLVQLDEFYTNKSQALQALKLSQKHDPKILRLREEMEAEMENLKQERRQLEFHIERTDLWAANIGKWKAHLYNSEILEEEGRKTAYFVIVVHLPGMLQSQISKGKSSTQGWVISRKIEDFLALHSKLIQLKPILKTKDLSYLKIKPKNLTEEKMKEIKDLLADYLTTLLQDEKLGQSETIFAFFSPSPEHLKQSTECKPKGKSSLAAFFKSSPVTRKDDSSDTDEELVFAEIDSSGKGDEKMKATDSIAGDLYQLIGEVFEVKGVFRWFRKTFIIFVKVTFGKSVNRQLRSTVNWMFSEPMLIYYLRLFKDTYWPNGQLAPPRPQRSDEEKLQARFMAKEKCTSNIPDALKNLVGDENAKRGATKIFEALQEPKLNRHLYYNVLLLLLHELFPEINEYDQQKLPEEQTVSA